MPFRRLILAVPPAAALILAALSTFSASPTSAQEADAGTVSWRFASIFIFGDERALLAFNFLIDEAAVEAAAPAPVVLEYGDPALLAMLAETPEEDAVLLLQAAGIVDMDGQVSGLQEVRTCRVWAPADDETLAAVATALGAELARVFSDFGFTMTPCEVTSEAAGADLYVFGETPPAGVDFSAFQFEGGFLEPVPFTPPPGSQQGGTGGGGPSPADTGAGVPEATPAGSLAVAGAAALAALALLVAGRALSRPRVR